MKQRVFLWTAPRCLSTAFHFSIGTLPNIKMFFEPYSVPYYRQYPCSYTPDSTLNFSYDEADKMIQADYPGKNALFVKDFPYEVRGRFDTFVRDDFKDFTHSFLIRNPQRAVLSHYSASSINFDEVIERDDIGFAPLCEFYFFLKEHLNISPVIIDADDLLASPEKMMEAYCNAVGFKYVEGMTKWEPGSGATKDFRDQMFFEYEWVDEAIKSSGFKKPTPLPPLPDDLPNAVKKCIDECFVPYNKLYSLRMTV